MKVLCASERPPYPFFLGGAARCAHRLLLALTQDIGVRCKAVGAASYSVTPWGCPERSEWRALGIRAAEGAALDCGYPVRVLASFRAQLGELIDRFQPDLVWSQLEGAKDILELAHGRRIQGLLYVHDAEFDPAEVRSIARLGCHLVGSSRFLAEKVGKAAGRAAHVVYPAPDRFPGTTGNRDGCLTMINPHRVKGLDTFLEIAKRMPSEKFLLVESWKLTDPALAALLERLAALPNVRFLRRVSDMRGVYGETRVLLMPSVWEEGFGMVAVEAQSCGVPVIASARGGLAEAVGDGGLLVRDYRDPDAWAKAIGTVLQDYGEYAGRASRHAAAEEFTLAFSARRFSEICSAKPHRFPRLGQMLRHFAR